LTAVTPATSMPRSCLRRELEPGDEARPTKRIQVAVFMARYFARPRLRADAEEERSRTARGIAAT